MWHPWVPSQPAAMLALQSQAERAGCAWACSFSSSAEFEAAVIRARRDAGAYGGKHRRRSIICGAVAIGALLALLLLLV